MCYMRKGTIMAKRGLYANIHAKKKRIAAGSGEKMRKPGSKGAPTKACLLYTSDAADDSLRVDLGGRRIIKKFGQTPAASA